jgi:hypothetical protein
MNPSQPNSGADIPAQRTNFLVMLFLFFLMLTAVCLHALRVGASEPARPAMATVEYAAAGS